MKKYRLAVMSGVIFIAALFCTSYTPLIWIPRFMFVFLILQAVLVIVQFLEVIHNWRAFRNAVNEDACEKADFIVVYKVKAVYRPFVKTLRTRSVMLGIHPYRAGPLFV